MQEQEQFCRNCNTLLQGEFCAKCGQREGRGDLHLSAVAGDLAEDFLHWDSRIWRTLVPLVLRPGFLTAEFIAGRKARYVPAFRLYLIISFVLFLVLSLESGSVSVEATAQSGQAVAGAESSTARPGDPDTSEDVADVGLSIDFRPLRSADLEAAQERGEEVIAPFVIGSDDTVALDRRINIGFADEDSPQWLKDLDQRLENNADRIAKDPGEFLAKLLEYLPQTMFVLLPLFAVLVKLCYLFSPFHYLQHLVFSLHYHSFVYLLSLFSTLVELVLPEYINDLLFLLVFLYLPLALRRAYGSSLAGALGKSILIIGADAVLLLCGFAGVALFTLATI